MRFAATHKVVSYLMVTTAFLMLALTGELPALLVLLTACGIVGSFFFDPQAHPFMQGRTYRYLWYATLGGLSLWLLPDPAHGESVWDSGTRLLCLFLVAKLWQRRGNGDYLQAYVISFLMLLAASLLGSSVLFAVCLLLYVTFSTWTLTLFHLRREMEENYLLKHLPGRHGQAAESERVEVERILNSRRVVGTSFLMVSGAASVAIFLIAGLVFLLLPRVGVSLELPLRRKGLFLTGFAEQIRLGSHGLLRDNPKVVMRVEVAPELRQPSLRFRGVAFDRYERGQWTRTRLHAERSPVLAQGRYILDVEATPTALADALRADIYLEPLESEVLFVPSTGPGVGPSGGPGSGRPLAIVLPEGLQLGGGWPLVVLPDEDVMLRGRRGGLRYTTLSPRRPPIEPPPLGRHQRPPLLLPSEQVLYTQVPESLRPVRELAQRVTASATSDAERARLLTEFLQRGFEYTTRLWESTQADPLLDFLFTQKRGHCEYFATALAMMLRTVNIPSRSVNGYLGGEWNDYGRYLVVRQQHAHSWVEAFLPGVGWTVLDATPVSAAPPRPGGPLFKLRQLGDSVEMSWSKYVIDYDLRAQVRLMERLGSAFSLWPRGGGGAGAPRPALKQRLLSAWRLALGLVALGLLGGLGVVVVRRRRAVREPAVRIELATQAQMRKALLLLKRRGFAPRTGETLQQLAARVQAAGDSSGDPFAELVRLYYAQRFGQESIDPALFSTLLGEMVRAPRRSMPA
jgi:hypothetical protein